MDDSVYKKPIIDPIDVSAFAPPTNKSLSGSAYHNQLGANVNVSGDTLRVSEIVRWNNVDTIHGEKRYFEKKYRVPPLVLGFWVVRGNSNATILFSSNYQDLDDYDTLSRDGILFHSCDSTKIDYVLRVYSLDNIL